ncbi:MAG: DUF1501 domain-containing protein [Fimbriiglobus sp.]
MFSRRHFLASAGAGFGAVALAALDRVRAADGHANPLNPLAPKPPHHAPKAKAVIWCFLDGGASHLDTFDPKPAIARYHGKPLPESFPRPVTAMGVTAGNPLMASTRAFRQHGKSGLWVSDLLPEMAAHADDLCVVRSCVADGLTHASSVLQMNTCSLNPGRPGLGAWAVYGLGSVADDMPGFVVMADSTLEPPGGPPVWGNGFLPSPYQGTRFGTGPTPILYADPPRGISPTRQRRKFELVQKLNRRYAAERSDPGAATGQLAAYELAFRMQASAPAVADLTRESADTLRMYGLDRKETEANGRNCLLARRLVERGVRFVQMFMGAGSRWDAHADLNGNHEKWCGATDRPIAALLTDLKRRGLLESTLVVWGGEFGRTPMSESGNGRDHNPTGFTVCLAGGGVKPGFVYGATDDLGLHAVENPVHVRDLHATILHQLGIDHEALTFPHNGRDEIVTGVGGTAVTEIVG